MQFFRLLVLKININIYIFFLGKIFELEFLFSKGPKDKFCKFYKNQWKLFFLFFPLSYNNVKAESWVKFFDKILVLGCLGQKDLGLIFLSFI